MGLACKTGAKQYSKQPSKPFHYLSDAVCIAMVATRIVFVAVYKLHKDTTSQEAMMLLDEAQWIHDGTVKRASG